MEYSWLIIALIAQLAWAFGIYIDKYLISAEGEEDDNTIGTLLIFSSFFSIIVAIVMLGIMLFLYGSAETLSMISFTKINLTTAILIGVFEMIWLIPYYYALHFTDEIVAPPIFQTIPVFIFIFGFLFFNEVPSTIHIIAGAIIVLGSLMLNIELIREETKDMQIRFNWKAVILMLFSSIIIALITLTFKETALEQNFWGTSFWVAVGCFIFGVFLWFLMPVYKNQFLHLIKTRSLKVVGLNMTNEVIDNIAVYAFLAAVLIAPSTALVQSTIAYQPILLLIIGLVLAQFGFERHARKLIGSELIKRTIAITIIVIGSTLIFV